MFNYTQWSGVTTTTQFSAPDATTGVVTQTNANFGLVINAAREPRYMQFSLRLSF